MKISGRVIKLKYSNCSYVLRIAKIYRVAAAAAATSYLLNYQPPVASSQYIRRN